MFSWNPTKKTRYNSSVDKLASFNISGQSVYTFSYNTLAKFPSSLLYKSAYDTHIDNLILDSDGNIYFDTLDSTFKHIHDYIKGYQIRFDKLSLEDKERLLKDATYYMIPDLVEKITSEMPLLTQENLNYWANIIAKSLIALGINFELIYKQFTGASLSFPVSDKIRDLLEKNTDIRDNVRKSVKYILEVKSQEMSPIDQLLLNILLGLSKDIDPTAFVDALLAKICAK
jgi:hypothetical protein